MAPNASPPLDPARPTDPSRRDEPPRDFSWRDGEGSSVILETVRDLLGARDSGEVLRRIAHRARELLTKNSAAVYLAEPVSGRMSAVAADGVFAAEFAGEVIAPGEGILGHIAESGSGEIVNDTLSDGRGIEIAGTPDTQAGEKLMGAPLRSRGATIGVMAVWRDAGEPPFSLKDLATLEALSSLAVVAIENARSYEESQLRIARLSSLMGIGRVLVSARDPSILLKTVHQQMSRIFDTTNFYIATYVEGSQEWVWELHYEGGARQPVERHELGAGLTGYIISNRVPVLLRDQEEIRAFLAGQGVLGLGELPQSWMGVPLIAGDEITGAMAIQNYMKPSLYDESDLEFFSLIGTQVAVALRNARLFEEAHAARKEAEEAKEFERRQLEAERREHQLTERLRGELQDSLEALRRTQSRLVTSEKMAVLGGLVSGMAHEINTPVGVALTAVTYLGEQARELAAALGPNGPAPARAVTRCLEGIVESVNLTQKNLARAAELISSFKQVSVDQTSEARRRFALGPYIAEVVQSLHPRLKRLPVSVEIDCPPDLAIDSYPGALSQILTNFIINSATHGFRGMEAGCVIRVKAGLSGTEALAIEYSDNGVGMSEEALNRLFEPFYTTTRGSGGTGLGATIAYNLVTQRLRGEISAASSPGRGLRYSIRIPLRGDSAPPREPSRSREDPPDISP